MEIRDPINTRRRPLCTARKSRDVNRSAKQRGTINGEIRRHRTPFFRREETRRHNKRPSTKPSAPVSGERATTLNILMAQYHRQCYRGRFICTNAGRES